MSAAAPAPTARQLLTQFEQRQRTLGHGIEGFVSASHGFLPIEPPQRALPASHRAWDEVAAALPDLYRRGGVRRALQGLPLLGAGPQHLPDTALCRAAHVLGILAHACARERELARLPLSGGDPLARLGSGADPDGDLPPALGPAWHTVCQRLGRPGACLAFSDLILYNWRLRDPAGERSVSNLELNTPTTGVAEERAFYLTMVESLARTAAAVELVVRAQDATACDDRPTLRQCLLALGDALRGITVHSLHQIDPNPHAPLHTDPIVWSRFVAPLAAPVRQVEPGLSGAAAPVFHWLDAFFGRARRDTKIGREMHHLEAWTPQQPRDLMLAIRAAAPHTVLAAHPDAEVRGLWRETLELYAGPHGWLGAHRLKVYGFMEAGFKAGRTSTTGGGSGQTETRAWERLDADIDDARRERFGGPPALAFGRKQGVRCVQASADGDIHLVEIDIRGSGLRYAPGDRCAVLPRNPPALVQRCLQALGTEANTPIALDRRWTAHLQALGQPPQGRDQLALGEWLALAQLRPLERGVARRLLALSGAGGLQQVLSQQREDELELSDALALMTAARYDVRRLWQAAPWEPESLARTVPPAPARVYSIASAPDAALPTRLDLAVRHLHYRSPDPQGQPIAREGSASSYLCAPLTPAEPAPELALRVLAAPRFGLPPSPQGTVVMFAGGSGIAPFRGFVQARAAQGAGRSVLVLGIRRADELPFADEVQHWVAQGSLELHAALSQQDAVLRSHQGQLLCEAAPRARVDALITGALAAPLSAWLEPGAAAHFYICGASAFARTVLQALQTLLQRRWGEAAAAILARMVAERRLMQDIFTTFAPASAVGPAGEQVIDASELVLHNHPTQGYWMALQGRVYDVGALLDTHPGGHQILLASVGTDATASYEAVEHHRNPEVHAMLDLYRIGSLRRIDFAGQWDVALDHSGVHTVSLQEAYATWLRVLYRVVDLENALHNNRVLVQRAATRDEPAGERNVLKARVALELRASFERKLLDAVVGASAAHLWQQVVAWLDPTAPVEWLAQAWRAVRSEPAAAAVDAWLDALHGALPVGLEAVEDASLARVWAGIDALEDGAAQLLLELKLALRDGAMAFERYGADTPAHGRSLVLAALQAVPEQVARYQQGLRNRAQSLGWVRAAGTP